MKLSRIFWLLALFFGILEASIIKSPQSVEFVANEVHKVGDISTANGNVLVYSQDYLVTAPRATYDHKNEIIELFDDVNILQNNAEATHSKYAKINVKTNEITTDKAFLMDQNKELWLESEQICSNDDRLDLNKSIVSSCNVENPDWHIEYQKGTYDKKEKYLSLYNSVFYGNLPLFGQTPLMYLPYFGFSTDKTRRTGFLAPGIGYSKGEGLYYEQPFYLAPYNSWDLEIKPQIRTSRGAGLYGTFRFADSAHSKGEIRAGFFKDKQSYAEKQVLKNDKHTGVEIEYERDKLAKYLLDGDYSEGLYLTFTHLNDIDYLNLQSGSHNNAFDSLVHSKLRYFLNTKEHYFGLYGDYYINTAKIATQYGNKDTLQELPTLHYHSYLDTFLSKNITYSFDAKYHNYTRKIGTKAQQFELNMPIGLNYTLPGEWANISWTNNFYASHTNYSNSYEYLANGVKRDRANDKYIRHWQEFKISSDLAKPYDAFGGLFHTMNLYLSYIQPGYKYGEIADSLLAYDKDIIEENFIEEIDEYYQKQILKAGVTQYLFDSKNDKILRHAFYTSYQTNKNRFYMSENQLELYFDKFKAFSKIAYDHDKNAITHTQHGLSFTYENLFFDIRHNYDKIYKDNGIVQKSNYLQTYANYTLPRNVKIFGAYAYDYELKYTKMWQIGISQNRKCWNYGIYFMHNTEPQNTANGPEPKTKNSIFVFFTFYPFGDFSYDASIASSDVK